MRTRARESVLYFLLTLCVALAVAVGMHVFVYPNDFAPSGVDGLATMLQKLTGINAGLFTLAINLPLLIAAWFVLKRRYVIYTVFYTVVLSLFLFVLGRVDFYRYVATGDLILPAVFGGVAQGLTGIMLRMGSSSGGVDIMGSMIQKKVPHRNVESIISTISVCIVIISFFVYRNLQSVLLSVVEIFVCERITAGILKQSRNAVKFEVVTQSLSDIKEDILHRVRHGATVIEGKGLYTEQGKSVIFCVVNYRQIPAFLKVVSKYPDTFVYYSDVMGVRGNFDRTDARKETEKGGDR
ncbi:MAG: YitT family protein [Clostridia bacterium]|nr:YitT family protein [Clostridia bacterium]